MAKNARIRKAKKTFSLSRQSVNYLESVRREKRARSVSAVLEEILFQQQQNKEMERIAASVVSYYDSLSNEEANEGRAWGDFAATQFPDER